MFDFSDADSFAKTSQKESYSISSHSSMKNAFIGKQGPYTCQMNRNVPPHNVSINSSNGNNRNIPHQGTEDNLQPLTAATQNSFVTAKQQLVSYVF